MSLPVLLIGLFVGFAGGLFGKGGSAVATPLLQLVGVPAFFAVASPLPAAIPGTLVASLAYVRAGLYDRRVVLWSVALGLPATVAGARSSAFVGGTGLLLLSNLVIAALGVSFLARPTWARPAAPPLAPSAVRWRSGAVGLGVGFLAGLLANAGGFLFAPLFARVLRLPLKTAFACSLVASALLAVPGTAVHVALGHVSWPVVLAFGLGSVPLSYLGARTAVRMNLRLLEPLFGVALLLIGAAGAAESLGWIRHL
ncbi:MAG TPA: sulfite exporter TauE/SafE family protein [Anaeromyxobacteraceae bacterium]|nr:sulfite exporter TauE/SafE family protein [Anaeromyxobacteraceae bacterium]